ncbi:MAG TPA: TrkA family potassium uptake protein [Thermomicrobiales bacterium]|nr:TrkA family potassium uptake protein [Thermomicrobiales bacterium]
MYILIVGGGKVGYYLTKTLVNEGAHEVLLIEKNRQKVETYTERFGSVVMQGNGDEAVTLAAAGAGRADVVIAVTGHDEDNLVICQVAKTHFNVPRAIARINNPKNEELFRRLGIDSTVSATNVILNVIEQLIPDRSFVHLMTLRHGDMSLVQGIISADSMVVGLSLAEIPFPPGVLIAAIHRGADLVLPTGATVLEAGDEIIAVAKRDQEDALRQLLTAA